MEKIIKLYQQFSIYRILFRGKKYWKFKYSNNLEFYNITRNSHTDIHAKNKEKYHL
jgi:hypothetical protein